MDESLLEILIQKLESLHTQADVDLIEAGLVLARYHQPDVQSELQLDRYRHHITKLALEVKGQGIDAMRSVIFDRQGYLLDTQKPAGHMENASLMRLIDRGAGGAIALTLLCTSIARQAQFKTEILDFAGAFLIRIEQQKDRIILNPAQNLAVMNAPDLRALIKRQKGAHAELSADYYDPLSNRAILVALQNTIKLYFIELEAYQAALDIVELSRALAPDEYRLLLDRGVLCARLNKPQDAIAALDRYIELCPDRRAQNDAKVLIHEIRTHMKI